MGGAGLKSPNSASEPGCLGPETDDGEIVTDRDEAHKVLDGAWEHGINFFDTANVYGDGDSERFIGDWLDDHERENFVIASKCYFDTLGRQEISLSRKAIRAEIKATLDRLKTDYLDLYYVHGWHEPSPIEETLSALNDLVREGQVHYIGMSNFTAWQLMQCQWLADKHDWESVSVTQPRFNAVDHYPYTGDPAEQPLPGLFDACRDQAIAVASYSPLAGGFLTGKYDRGPDGDVRGPDGSRVSLSDNFGPFSDRAWSVLETIQTVAEELDATPAQVALRWVMDVGGVASIPIVGARSTEQLQENAGAVEISISADQFDRISDAGMSDIASWPVYEN